MDKSIQSSTPNPQTHNTPALRFPEFTEGVYYKYLFRDIFIFSTGKNIKQNEASPEFETPCVRYGELYHMYSEVITEIINKTNLDESELLFSDGDEILLPSAGEDPMDIGSASALTIENIAIGRTINILKPLKADIYSQIYVAYYINHKLKKKISTLAKGVSISNVYNSDLKTLEIILPSLPEQQKIAAFLTAIDKKISHLKEKKALLEEYKKGVMQQIFSQKLRFKKENGEDFEEWEYKELNQLLSEPKKRNFDLAFTREDVLSVSGELGIVNQIEHLGRSYAGESIANYHVVQTGDIVYTKSPLKSNPYGIIKVNKGKAGIVSTLYAVYSCKENLHGEYLDYYFQIDDNTNSYLRPLVRKGAKNDMKINNTYVLSGSISIPSKKEQEKIVRFLNSLDNKITQVREQLEGVQKYKKGLLQKMFV